MAPATDTVKPNPPFAPTPRLSARERRVLSLMAEGLSNDAIARTEHLSIKSVEATVGSVFVKLGLHADRAVNRRVLAVRTWLRQGGEAMTGRSAQAS